MEFVKNKTKIVFILFFYFLFFNPLIIQAMPKGTILYKTGENGKMYGRDDYYEFSLIPGKTHFGGVGIYVGKDKLTKEPTVFEVDYSGVRRIPAKYFVDLDKGEKFIGAKIPKRLLDFGGMTNQIYSNILTQIGEGFDFTYHKQKGPQSGDWTPAGFVEKIYESAKSTQLAYYEFSVGEAPSYSINITPDGYDDESEINEHHDVFSEEFEHSRIHTLSSGDFWEQFFNKEIQDTLNSISNKLEQEQNRLEKDAMQKWENELKGKKVKDKDMTEDYRYVANLEKFSKIAKGIKDIVNVTIYGTEHEKDRYFFFPYTQFQQITLMHVDVDASEVSSHGKMQAVGGLSLIQKRVMMTTSFFERLVYNLATEKGKELVMNVLGINEIISSINAVKTSIGVGEEGINLLSGGKLNIDTGKIVKETFKKNKYAQAALSFEKDADRFYQAGIDESLEFFDLVNKGYLKGPEFDRKMELELARISGEDEEIIDTRPIVRQLGDVIDISPIDIEKEIEKELKKLENKKIKDKDLEKLKELIDDEVNQDKPDEVELPQEEVEEPEEILKTSTFKKGDILINEFMPNPISDESEWIELYNKTDSQISLDNWTIEDNTAKPKSLSGLIIKPKSWLLLTQGQDFSFKLNNPGDIITLKYIDTLIDSVTYGNFDDGNINNNAPKPEKGQSLARLQNSQDTNQDNNDWFITTTPTQNLINKITAPIIEPIVQPVSYGGGGSGSSSPSYQAYQTGDVVINEIMYNVSGSDSGHEWIEIYNPGSSEIDLNSWKFYEAETNHRLVLKQGSWILSIGVYAVIADDADQFLLDYPDFTGTIFDSSFSLNNTSETVVLKDGKENTINEVLYLSEWGGNDNGKTIEKQADESWTESSVDKGTPGKENSEQSYSASGEQDPEPDPDTTAPIITLLGDSEINLETGVSYVDVGATALDDVDGDITANIDIANPVNTNIPGSYIIAYNVSDSADNPAEQIIRTVIISEPISEEQPDEFQQYSLADVVVSEIAWMGTKASEYDEWIELYNNLDNSVNLSGWHLQSNDNTPNIVLEGIIPAYSYWILERSDDTTINSLMANQIYTGILNNNGEHLQLKDGTEKIIDELDFSSRWPAGSNEIKASMERIDFSISGSLINNWQTNSGKNLFALDTDGNDILGTPRQENSEKTDVIAPVITLLGDNPITIEVNSSYADAGATALDDVDGDITANIITGGNTIDTSVLGIYIITYKVSDSTGNSATEVIRTVIVSEKSDTTLPISSIDDPGDIFNAASLPETIGGDISPDTEQVEIQIKRGKNSDYLDDDNDVHKWHADRDDIWITRGVILDKENNNWSYNLPLELLQEQDNHYFIRSRAKDGSENIQSNYSEINFIFDKTPPGQVITSDVREKDSPLDLEFFWSEVRDNFSGIDYYEIEWNGGNATSTDGTVFRLTGENRTDYSFKVKACDKAGNCGEFSNSKKRRIQKQSLIINEIQVNNNEFIELYNPTNENISLDDWQFAYYSSSQDWSGATSDNPNKIPHRLKQFPNGAVIKSKGYYLIGVYGYSKSSVDWQVKTNTGQAYLNGQLSNTAGSVVIYSSDLSGKSSDKLKKQYIDAVAWGDVQHVKEKDAYPLAPEQDKSLQRKENQDKDDNANDFFIQESPSPQSVYGLWLNGWNKRKLLVIDNKQNSNNLTDYQIKINVTHQSEMQSDFSDIRFTSSNGKTLLPYYCEEYVKDDSAIFWVKVPEIQAYSEAIIYQYYDNVSATYEGNGEDVFIWFDDFSTDRSEEYDNVYINWDTKRKRIKLSENAYISPLDNNSGENLEMKNFYIKTKMYLEKETDNYHTNMARQAFIDYRHNDNNSVPTSGNFDDDDYLKFGVNNQVGYNVNYRGLRFDKNIYTKDVDRQAINILKRDGTMSDYFDKWGVYEVRAYETNHQVDFIDEDLKRTTWNITSHYLDEKGNIYLRALDVSSTSWVWIDYLMIGQSTLPEPTIVINKPEGYTAVNGQIRNSYPEFLDWGERKKIKISNIIGNSTSTDDVIDYAIEIKIDYLDVDGAKKDFSDIRFIDSDKKTILKYWNESYEVDTEGNPISAIFWVKVPKIPGTISDNRQKIIYMYYDNPSATYIGKGEDVFVWFDDFEIYRHSEYKYSSVDWKSEQGRIKFNNNGYITPLDELGKNLEIKDVYIKTKMYLEKETDHYHTNMAHQEFVDYRYQDANSYWRFGLNYKYNYIDKRGVIFGGNFDSKLFFMPLSQQNFQDQWGVFEIWAVDTEHSVKFSNDFGDVEIKGGIKSNSLDKEGKIYLRALDVASTSWMWVDYLIISKYNPEIKVSDVY